MDAKRQVDVAKYYVERGMDEDKIVYQSRNGQYLIGKAKSLYAIGRPQWTLKEFIEEHRGG